MILKPSRPVREHRFLLTYKLHGGETIQQALTPQQDVTMEKTLQSFSRYMHTQQPIEAITIEFGDRQEAYIPAGEEPLTGLQTSEDIK